MPFRLVLLLLLLLASLAGACAGPSQTGAPAPAVDGAPLASEPLPTDPAIVAGRLDNGLRYLVRRHANPAGRAAFWLHVHTGSLDETEAERGIAHFLEHMAFNGSANFPPGTVVPLFEALGMAFGRDQNAFTSFTQTTYQMALPDVKPATLDKGLLFLSDVAFRLLLRPEDIDRERFVILEEKRARSGPDQRIRDAVFPRLAPGSIFGRRPPIGEEETIRRVGVEDFRAFYARRYVASNMTVLGACDCEPADVLAIVRRHFGGAPTVPRPPPQSSGVTPTRGVRAVVATDPELTRASVSLVRVSPPRTPSLTVADARRDLTEGLAVAALDRRMEARIAEGKVRFLEAGVSLSDIRDGAFMATARAGGPPAAWPGMLDDLAATVQQARRHGFTERDLEPVRAALLAQAEADVQAEATRPARSVLRELNDAATQGEPAMSAAQRLALFRRLLPGITAREVSAAFAGRFDFTDAVVVASLPAGSDVPAETDLAARGRTALAVEPGPPAESARATSLLDTPPRPGTIVERTVHAASGVTSVWLDNGVRVHHRLVAQRRNEATVRITLAGGIIEEDAATRGLTRAATIAWDRPATRTLTSVQIRDLLAGRNVQVGNRLGSDLLGLVVSGTPADLETGLQLAYRLLTDPVIEPAAFDQWREAEQQALAARRTRPAAVLSDALSDAIYPPGDVRVRTLTEGQVRAVRPEAAQAWLLRLLASAPIEVAIVGDIDLERALALATRYVGALAPRPRIDAKTLHDRRVLPRPGRAVAVTATVTTTTEQAVVLDGFFGADLRHLRDARLLAMAARVLSSRMVRTVREERGLVYSIGAVSRPAVEYPGFGLFAAQAPTDPGKTARLAATLEEMYAAFAKDGPSADEVAVARRQLASVLAETMPTPDFWIERLDTLDYRGIVLDDVMEAPARYAEFTGPEIRDAFARYYRPDARIRAVVTPR